MHFLVLLEGHLEAADDEHRAEDVDDPVEFFEQGDARADEHRAHDQRPNDAPEQHLVLILRGHFEVGEDEEEDEEIVHAQR